uniref:Uncharacterized protein n=1 Tax=Arundo donax TaxID=35708 RepID=A0A0A9AGA8_ARUDO
MNSEGTNFHGLMHTETQNFLVDLAS